MVSNEKTFRKVFLRDRWDLIERLLPKEMVKEPVHKQILEDLRCCQFRVKIDILSSARGRIDHCKNINRQRIHDKNIIHS